MFTKIYFSRTACYGGCPVFDVEINQDGTVMWNGGWYVYRMGSEELTITQGKIKKLERLLEEFGYRTFTYPQPDFFMTDQASCITRVVFEDGSSKEVEHCLGHGEAEGEERKHSLANLERFEKSIEQIVGLRKYIRFPKGSV